MARRWLVRCGLWSSLPLASVVSHEAYATKVPNGRNVDGVPAIGHTNPAGSGIRNAFGRDFYSAGHTWTLALCHDDSDGDGQTNGEELGDPCCEWTPEAAQDPRWSTGVSNPGDEASTSNETLWPRYECAAQATSTRRPQTGNHTTQDGPSTAGSVTSTARVAWHGIAPTTVAIGLTLLAALVP